MSAEQIADPIFPLRDIQGSCVKDLVASMRSVAFYCRNEMIVVMRSVECKPRDLSIKDATAIKSCWKVVKECFKLVLVDERPPCSTAHQPCAEDGHELTDSPSRVVQVTRLTEQVVGNAEAAKLSQMYLFPSFNSITLSAISNYTSSDVNYAFLLLYYRCTLYRALQINRTTRCTICRSSWAGWTPKLSSCTG